MAAARVSNSVRRLIPAADLSNSDRFLAPPEGLDADEAAAFGELRDQGVRLALVGAVDENDVERPAFRARPRRDRPRRPRFPHGRRARAGRPQPRRRRIRARRRSRPSAPKSPRCIPSRRRRRAPVRPARPPPPAAGGLASTAPAIGGRSNPAPAGRSRDRRAPPAPARRKLRAACPETPPARLQVGDAADAQLSVDHVTAQLDRSLRRRSRSHCASPCCRCEPRRAAIAPTNRCLWRPRPESNRGARICSPLRSHSATRPCQSGRPPRRGAIASFAAPPQGVICANGSRHARAGSRVRPRPMASERQSEKIGRDRDEADLDPELRLQPFAQSRRRRARTRRRVAAMVAARNFHHPQRMNEHHRREHHRRRRRASARRSPATAGAGRRGRARRRSTARESRETNDPAVFMRVSAK